MHSKHSFHSIATKHEFEEKVNDLFLYLNWILEHWNIMHAIETFQAYDESDWGTTPRIPRALTLTMSEKWFRGTESIAMVVHWKLSWNSAHPSKLVQTESTAKYWIAKRDDNENKTDTELSIKVVIFQSWILIYELKVQSFSVMKF